MIHTPHKADECSEPKERESEGSRNGRDQISETGNRGYEVENRWRKRQRAQAEIVGAWRQDTRTSIPHKANGA